MSAPRITTTQLATAVVGEQYAQALTATGGTAPYVWSVQTMPAGITLNGSSIHGIPTSIGTRQLTIQVTDSAHQIAQVTLTLTCVAALAITTTTLPGYIEGQPYSAQLSATGGVPPYTWTLVGTALPAGLVLSSSGTITGTPTATGVISETFEVTDNG